MKSYHNVVIQRKRTMLAIGFFFLAFILIFCRLVQLQVYRHDYYSKIASAQHWIADVIPAKRGKIFVKDTLTDESYLLATNQSLDMVYVIPEDLENRDTASTFLASVLAMKKEEIIEKLNSSDVYVPIKHKITADESNRIREGKLKGVVISSESWRYYPENTLAANLLGFVNDERKGNYGLEEHFDQELRGVDGQLKEEADTSGVTIAFGNNVSRPAIDGENIYLTIDRYIQMETEKKLTEAVKKFNAVSGSVIVMEPTSGKILAMANNPTFNPNEYSKVSTDDYEVFKNRAVVDVYEPGSVFKVITMAAGLDAGKITPETKYIDTGQIILDGHKIMNSDKKTHGEQTMKFVLEESLNTGSTWVQQQVGKDGFFNYIEKFGFGQLTGIEFPGEATGRIYRPDELNDHGYATMSFGQSISATPIQMITSFATIANKGEMPKPYIVEKIEKDGKVIEENKPQNVSRVISQKSARDLTEMMISVVENGHGKQAQVAGYKVAGKTGTAQVVKEGGGGYESGKNIGTFIGFAPAYNPRFVVMAKIDEPKGIPWAESSAAPIVGKMLDFLLKYYQVPPA